MTDENLLKKYLLGDLGAEERTRFEDEYFGDSNRFEEIVEAEIDLIDSYARGALSNSDRFKFEQQYGQLPERRVRIDFAKTLTEAINSESESVVVHEVPSVKSFLSYFQVPKRQLQWAFASLALLIVGVLLLRLQTSRLRGELHEARVNSTILRQERDTLRSQIIERGPLHLHIPEDEQDRQVARLEPGDLAFRLTAGAQRSSGARQKDLVISSSLVWVRLEMVLDQDDYNTYDAVLMTAEGKEVSRVKSLLSHSTAGSTTVAWRLPALLIHSGDFIVQLTGRSATASEENVASFSFRAVRKQE